VLNAGWAYLNLISGGSPQALKTVLDASDPKNPVPVVVAQALRINPVVNSAGSVGEDAEELYSRGASMSTREKVAIGVDLAVNGTFLALAVGGPGTTGSAPRASAYSSAAEVRLPVSAWGRSAAVHENAANGMLHDSLLVDLEYRAVMEGLIPGVTDSVSSVGGRATPAGWIWHHELESGVMSLVPEAQHTPGSAFWDVLHPDGYGGYASWARAFGAPPR
jgi:hypothetical protein